MFFSAQDNLFKESDSYQVKKAFSDVNSIQMKSYSQNLDLANKINNMNKDINNVLMQGNDKLLKANEGQENATRKVREGVRLAKELDRLRCQKHMRIRLAYYAFIIICSFILIKRILNFKVTSLLKYI